MISIIVPVYNGENYIENLIVNLQNQSYQDFELIIIDDGSNDNTVKIAKNYTDIDKRIWLYSFENHGVSWARNKGMSLAKGNYFMFLDCDDEIDCNYLEIVHNSFNYNPSIDAVFTRVDVINEKKQILKVQTMQNRTMSNDETLKKILDFSNINTGPCAKVYKSKFIKLASFPPLKIYEDLIFNLDVLRNEMNIYFEDKVAYKYIHRENVGAMSSFQKKYSNDVIVAMDYAISCIPLDEDYDYLFYRVISQVMMYGVKCTLQYNKYFILETKRFLKKHFKDLMRNKVINRNEKILFIIYSISFNLYTLVRRLI